MNLIFLFSALAAVFAIAYVVKRYFFFRLKRVGKYPADFVIFNAKVFTSNSAQPHAQALAVKEGVITYVGSNEGVQDYAGKETELVDGRGRRVTPGFIDNHCHVLWIGSLMSLMTKELYACESVEEVKKAVAKQSRENPELPFVGGVGWRTDYVPGGLPRKEILDEVELERPVFLMAYSGQGGWLNSKAVDLLIKRNPEAFEALVPARDEKTGEPVGYLKHYHAINFLDFYTWEELGDLVQNKMMEAIEATLAEAVSCGVTTMNDVQIYREFMPLLLKFKERGGFEKARVRGSFYVAHEDLRDEEKLVADLEWWKETGKEISNDHFVMGDSVKFYIDGTADNHTAFMFEPFLDNPSSTGEPVWTQEEFDRVVEIVDRMGLQACTHNCGDAGSNRVVNSYERAIRKNGPRDARHRSEHCELPLPADIKRMAELGIHASMQPNHFFGNDRTEKIFGKKRLQGFMPWRSLEKAGVTVSFGSDWCAGPINPMYGLLIASTRMNNKLKTDWGPNEKITIEDAIRHWTIDSAHALFMENMIGSIEKGKQADLVIFNTDPLKINSWWFLLTHKLELGAMDDFVDMVFVEGKEVFRRRR